MDGYTLDVGLITFLKNIVIRVDVRFAATLSISVTYVY